METLIIDYKGLPFKLVSYGTEYVALEFIANPSIYEFYDKGLDYTRVTFQCSGTMRYQLTLNEFERDATYRNQHITIKLLEKYFQKNNYYCYMFDIEGLNNELFNPIQDLTFTMTFNTSYDGKQTHKIELKGAYLMQVDYGDKEAKIRFKEATDTIC